MSVELSKNKTKGKIKTAFSAIEIAVVVVMGAFMIYIVMEPAKRMIANSKCSQNKTSVKDKVSSYSDIIEGSNQYEGIKAIDDDKAFKDCINAEMGLSLVSDSCKTILDSQPSSTSGVYTLTAGHKVYCDMVTDGGGWTLIVAQYEADVADETSEGGPGGVNTWNEGIQLVDYMINNVAFVPSLLDVYGGIARGFTLNSSEIPSHTQIAFGKGSDPTFAGYSDFEYVIGNIAVQSLLNLGSNGGTYEIHRDDTAYYGNHDPENGGLVPNSDWNDTLTYDKIGGSLFNWSFSPHNVNTGYRGLGMNPGTGSALLGSENYSWTVWVR
jgi:hypothetical protein